MTYPSYGWDFFWTITMKPLEDVKVDADKVIRREKNKVKKLVIEVNKEKKLSDLGKTVSELKNGVYRLDRLPED